MSSVNNATVYLVGNDATTVRVTTDPIKDVVRDVLGISSTLDPFWDVINHFPSKENAQFATAMYNADYDPLNRLHAPLRKVRGVIVDLEKKLIRAESYGYTHTLPCHEPIVFEKDAKDPSGKIIVQTEITTYLNSFENAPEEPPKISIGAREFDADKTKLFIGYEGSAARIWKGSYKDENGAIVSKVFFSTHRRIDAANSSWQGKTPFLEIYNRLGGPAPESLFGEEKDSPYCYNFLIVDNELKLATSTKDNRVIFLGAVKLWESEEKTELKLPSPKPQGDAFSSELNRGMITQPPIDVEMANKFLYPSRFAKPVPSSYKAQDNEIVVEYSGDGTKISEIYAQKSPLKIKDERLAGGDFVILYTQTPSGDTVVYRLETSACEYRAGITDNNPNLYNRFVTKMVDFTKADPKEITDTYPRYDSADGRPMDLTVPANRQNLWWSLFWGAVPPSYKDEVDEFYSRYEKDVNKVANFILTDYPKIVDPNNPDLKGTEEQKKKVIEEVKRIDERTKLRIENLRETANGAAKKTRQPPYVIIRGMLLKETGPSLYRMITTVQNIEKFRRKLAAKI